MNGIDGHSSEKVKKNTKENCHQFKKLFSN